MVAGRAEGMGRTTGTTGHDDGLQAGINAHLVKFTNVCSVILLPNICYQLLVPSENTSRMVQRRFVVPFAVVHHTVARREEPPAVFKMV